MTLPEPYASQLRIEQRGDVYCEQCGEPCSESDWNAVALMLICPRCIETQVEALNYERTCEAH